MGRQVTRQRLALGFPRHGVRVAAKSGTWIGLIRNEAGVITMPDGRRYAAAVFTRADRQWDREHEINAAIGAAAALAVARGCASRASPGAHGGRGTEISWISVIRPSVTVKPSAPMIRPHGSDGEARSAFHHRGAGRNRQALRE